MDGVDEFDARRSRHQVLSLSSDVVTLEEGLDDASTRGRAADAILLQGSTKFLVFHKLTIRLTVFARRKEIAIMKYVGATDWFIRWPFVMEGMVLGLFGSIIAAMVLRTAYTAMAEKVYDTLAFFPLIPEQPFLTYITIVVVISGMVVGAIGSAVSIKKFLKV